jgi:Malate/L-lactate dehydrogenase
MDSEGSDTIDAAAVLAGGAVKPFDAANGGHKGTGLALVVELLAGPLVGAAVADKVDAGDGGNLVVAIDPSILQVRSFPHKPCAYHRLTCWKSPRAHLAVALDPSTLKALCLRALPDVHARALVHHESTEIATMGRRLSAMHYCA